MSRRSVLLTTTLLLLIAALAGVALHRTGPTPNPLPVSPGRIAHAGGGLDGKTYLNSIAAIDHNYDLGFRLFEVDLAEDGDGGLVCIHQWGDFLSGTDWTGSGLPGRADFERLRISYPPEYRPCTIEELIAWLGAHEDAVLVSDFKTDRERGLGMLAELTAGAGIHVIPQVYQPDQYDLAVELGFPRIIWTLYNFGGSQEDVVRVAREKQPYAVTMPPARAVTPLGQRPDGSPIYLASVLGQMDIATYVHTINEPADLETLRNVYGVTDIYTDFLAPEPAPPAR